MNANSYVDQILLKYEVEKGPGTAVYQAGERLRGLIQRWYSTRLVTVENSGSFAKNTSIKGGTDLDLFISLNPRSGKNLKSIFNGLYDLASRENLNPRRQNVSIGVQLNGVKVDLVPARKHKGKSDHSLFLNRTGGWTKTNVDKHIGLVRNSGKSPAIRVLLPRDGGDTRPERQRQPGRRRRIGKCAGVPVRRLPANEIHRPGQPGERYIFRSYSKGKARNLQPSQVVVRSGREGTVGKCAVVNFERTRRRQPD